MAGVFFTESGHVQCLGCSVKASFLVERSGCCVILHVLQQMSAELRCCWRGNLRHWSVIYLLDICDYEKVIFKIFKHYFWLRCQVVFVIFHVLMQTSAELSCPSGCNARSLIWTRQSIFKPMFLPAHAIGICLKM